MIIKKAIRNLKAGRKDCGMIPEKEYTATIDLAISALRRVKGNRMYLQPIIYPLLPGETEERGKKLEDLPISGRINKICDLSGIVVDAKT